MAARNFYYVVWRNWKVLLLIYLLLESQVESKKIFQAGPISDQFLSYCVFVCIGDRKDEVCSQVQCQVSRQPRAEFFSVPLLYLGALIQIV